MCVDIACEFCRSRDCDSGMKDDERPHRNVKNPPEISPTDFFYMKVATVVMPDLNGHLLLVNA